LAPNAVFTDVINGVPGAMVVIVAGPVTVIWLELFALEVSATVPVAPAKAPFPTVMLPGSARL
jgi:hypothetical protein